MISDMRPWTARDLRARYDLACAVLGYESRATHAMRTLKPNASCKISWGFGVQEELAYQDNREWFSSAGFDCKTVPEIAFESEISSKVRELSAERREFAALVDISSATRSRLAHIVWTLSHASCKSSVDFVYSIAQFQPPPKRHTRNAAAGPVSCWFAGWWGEPERPLSAIVGLGYEEDKALGMVEHLEAPEVWTLEPVSQDPDYVRALEISNRRLMDLVPRANRLKYQISQPTQTFYALESLVDGLSRSCNTILVPFGPKLFTLVSLLVALRHRTVPVWRVSGGTLQKARDSRAGGPIYGLRVEFGDASVVA